MLAVVVVETAIAGMNFHVEGEQDEQNLDELIPGTELKLYGIVSADWDEEYKSAENYLKKVYIHVNVAINFYINVKRKLTII